MYTRNEIRDYHSNSNIQWEGSSCYQQIGLKFKEEASDVLHCERSFVWCWKRDTAEVDHKCLASCKMWSRKRMEKIIWTDRLNKWSISITKIQGEKKILYKVKRIKDNWIGHILHRNCLLKHVIEGKKERLGRRGRRRKQLIDALQEMKR